MSKNGIFAMNPERMERVDYADAKSLAKEICDSVRCSGIAATVQTELRWWAKATISPWVGPVTNWSIRFPDSIEISDLLEAIEAEGMFVSYYADYPNYMVVDKEEYEVIPGHVCVLPE